MNEFDQEGSINQEVPTVDAIKERIAQVSTKPLSEHSEEFEAIHADLQKVLSNIDGL